MRFYYRYHGRRVHKICFMVCFIVLYSAYASASGLPNSAPVAQPSQISPSASSGKSAPNPSHTGSGAVTLPGTNTAITIGGTIKALANFDTGASTGDTLEPFNIPLHGVNAAALKGGHFGGNVRWSKINLKSETPIAQGTIKAFVEFDFAGGPSINTSGTSYTPRLRFAYVENCELGLVGQTNSLFEDTDAVGSNLDPNGILGGNIRQPQVRFTQKFNAGSFSVSLEYPVTDYTDNTGARQITNNGYGVSSAPDVLMQLKLAGNPGHVALRAMMRQVAVKYIVDSSMSNPTYPNCKKSVTGWGLGLSGRLFTQGKSGLFAQVNGGEGVGRYIPVINGQAAFFDVSRGILKSQSAINTFGGYEHHWTDELRTNIMTSYTYVRPSTFSPQNLTSTTRITKRMHTYWLNVIYCPIPKLEVGMEFARVERYTLDRKKGDENRIIFALNYTI